MGKQRQKKMSQKNSRETGEREDSRGCCGCFGWLLRLFRRKRRGRRHKHKDFEPSLTPSPTNLVENSIDLPNGQGEGKCEEKEKGAAMPFEDVEEAWQAEMKEEEQEPEVVKTWAEEVDEAEEKGWDVFAPVSCLPHIVTDTEASPENEATAATATGVKMSDTQRRRARRKALAAAWKASTETQAASVENEAPTTTQSGKSATRRRRARRKALTARLKSETGGCDDR